MTTIVINGTKTASVAPTILQDRELYINQSDEKLFYKNSAGVIKSLDLTAGGSFTQTDETGAVAMPYIKKLRRTLYFGDRKNNITGNGTSDDTAAVQDDITYANTQGLQLLIPEGMKLRTTSTLNCAGWTRIKGRGGQLQKNNANPNALGPWSGFFFDHTGIGLNCASADGNTFDRADLEDFLIIRPQPTPVAGQTWTPTTCDFDINYAQTSGNILGVECLRSTNFIRIDRNVGNQVLMDRLKGQVFNVGVQIKCAMDSVYLRMAHFWPYWTGGFSAAANPVLQYQLSAHIGLHVMRCDGLSVGDLFCFAPRSTVLIDKYDGGGNTAIAGTLNNGTFHKIYNDNGASAITAVAAATGFFFRGNLVENYGAPTSLYTGAFNGIDNGAPSSLLDISAYWSNNARNSHAAAQAAKAYININRFIEGAWNLSGGTSASLVGNSSGAIDVQSWRKADAISSNYSTLSAGLRYAGNVKGPLSDGLTTITTDANGQATWAHNAGQMPVTAKVTIYDGGAGAAATFRRTGLTATNILGTLYTAAGATVPSRSDIILDWSTATTYQPIP